LHVRKPSRNNHPRDRYLGILAIVLLSLVIRRQISISSAFSRSSKRCNGTPSLERAPLTFFRTYFGLI